MSKSTNGDNNLNEEEVKKGRLDKKSEIYDHNRSDKMDKKLWSTMNRKEKLIYFKDYYLKYVIIVIILIPIVFYVVKDMTRKSTEDSFRCGILNSMYMDPDRVKPLLGDLDYYMTKDVDYMGSKNEERMYIQTYTASFADDVEINGFYERRKFDVLIMNQDTYQSYAKNCQLTDLKTVLPEAVLDKVKDHFVYAKDINGNEAAYGITLDPKWLALFEKVGEEFQPVESAIITIPNNTKRLEAATEFIKFLVDEDKYVTK